MIYTPFQLLYGQEAIMPIELELTFLHLALQAEELNSTDISQRMNALLALEEQRSHALDNLKRRSKQSRNILIKRLNLLILRLMRKYYSRILLMLKEEDIPNFKNCG
jgi:hypothetical protein